MIFVKGEGDHWLERDCREHQEKEIWEFSGKGGRQPVTPIERAVQQAVLALTEDRNHLAHAAMTGKFVDVIKIGERALRVFNGLIAAVRNDREFRSK